MLCLEHQRKIVKLCVSQTCPGHNYFCCDHCDSSWHSSCELISLSRFEYSVTNVNKHRKSFIDALRKKLFHALQEKYYRLLDQLKNWVECTLSFKQSQIELLDWNFSENEQIVIELFQNTQYQQLYMYHPSIVSLYHNYLKDFLQIKQGFKAHQFSLMQSEFQEVNSVAKKLIRMNADKEDKTICKNARKSLKQQGRSLKASETLWHFPNRKLARSTSDQFRGHQKVSQNHQQYKTNKKISFVRPSGLLEVAQRCRNDSQKKQEELKNKEAKKLSYDKHTEINHKEQVESNKVLAHIQKSLEKTKEDERLRKIQDELEVKMTNMLKEMLAKSKSDQRILKEQPDQQFNVYEEWPLQSNKLNKSLKSIRPTSPHQTKDKLKVSNNSIQLETVELGREPVKKQQVNNKQMLQSTKIIKQKVKNVQESKLIKKSKIHHNKQQIQIRQISQKRSQLPDLPEESNISAEVVEKLELIPRISKYLEENLLEMEQAWRKYDLMCWNKYFDLKGTPTPLQQQQYDKCKNVKYNQKLLFDALESNSKKIKITNISKKRNFLILKYMVDHASELIILFEAHRSLTCESKYKAEQHAQVVSQLEKGQVQKAYGYIEKKIRWLREWLN